MSKIRIGLVGCGGMGRAHLNAIKEIEDATLVGVCDINKEQAERTAKDFGCQAFTDYKTFVTKDNLDAVLIATPHYYHPPIAIWAFEHDIHVLCEKPIAVHINDALSMIDAHKKHSALKFGIVFQRRLAPIWKQIKKMIDTGQTGRIMRISWIVTSWYRTQSYYNQGGWRGTWKGEGGGVLMNQCPHQLDVFQWLFGMPEQVSAICEFGKYHEVEIEDDITAIMKYSDGTTATFIATTGEFPGTNRLEIACDKGRIVVEDERTITFDRTVESISEFTKTAQSWQLPEVWNATVPVRGEDPGYKGMSKNFIKAIKGEEPIAAPGEEGINSLMLANAIVYAGYKNVPVNLPLDGNEYESFLKQMIKENE